VLRGASSAQSRSRVRPRPLAPGAWAVAHPACEPIYVTMRLLSTSGPRPWIRRIRPAAPGTLEGPSPRIPRQRIPWVLPRTIRHNRTLRARSRPGTPLCRDLRHGPISPPSQTGESRHDALPTHAAHSQWATGALLMAPARLIPHPPKACRLLQPTRETLPPTSSLLPVWTIRSITSGVTRVARCARVSAERGLLSNNFRRAAG